MKNLLEMMEAVADLPEIYCDMDQVLCDFMSSADAVVGGSFHRLQARILKSVIDVYDIFIVYAGNNEGNTFYTTKGVWSGEPTKDLTYPDFIVLPIIASEKIILNSSFLNDITEFINTNSRL